VGKIVGGVNAQPNQYPWQVYKKMSKKYNP
jgi:hypothetical protein